MKREGGWRNALGLGVSFAFSSLCSWHLGIVLALILALMSMAFLVRGSRPRAAFSRELAVAALSATVLALPLFSPMLVEVLGGRGDYLKPSADKGVDIAFLFRPAYGHPLWARFVADAYANRAYPEAGFVCFLGFVPMGLAAWSVWHKKTGVVFWSLLLTSLQFIFLALDLLCYTSYNVSLISKVTTGET
jgi:hypothetical protein